MMTDNATEKFDLVNDEDSCCGLMHIVDDHENFICSGYDERNMVGIVDKLNQHDELVEALRNAVCIIDFEDGTKTINEARDLLAKIDSHAGGEK
jgi:hypothetical protein